MNLPPRLLSVVQSLRQRPLLLGALAVAALILVVSVVRATRPAGPQYTYYEAKRGDLLISIVEGGTLEAVNEQIVRSEVEGTARIIFIVKEGTYVKKGDLLVELDSSAVEDAVNQQQINVEKAQFAFIQAEQQLEIQRSIVESEIQAAKLKVEFAQSDLDKYIKGEALRARRDAEIEITNVMETLKINQDRLEWTERLYAQNYETKNNLDKDRLAVSQARLKLEQAEQALWLLQTFDEPKTRRKLEAALQEAKEELARVQLQGERKLAQYEADVQTQKSTLELSRRKLERDLKQLAATKIYAPQDGLVVYAGGGDRRFSSESLIEEGAVVRNRQEIIKLPDVSSMKLSVKIHESHIGNVRVGQPAFVVLDALPDQRFRGEVSRVAPLPDSQSRWGNPNLKVYATEILITDPLPDVKPGVSARAEIIITNLSNVVSVPIQAVTTRRGQPVVFLERNPKQPVPVSVGLFNTKFIEITSGVQPGDRVLLSPPFDTEEKDLSGAILAGGEPVPEPSSTNRPPRSFPREPSGSEAPAAEPRFGPNGPRREPGFQAVGEPGSGRARPDGPGARPRFNREEMLKLFDKNGDGELDEEERAAMQERFGRGRRSGSGTNTFLAPPPGSARPDDSR